MRDKIINYIRAGFAGLYLVTSEEARAEAEISAAAESLGCGLRAWSVTGGLIDPATGAASDLSDPIEAVEALADLPEKTVLVLRDFHLFLGDQSQPANPILVRTLRNQLRHGRTEGKTIVITGCLSRVPPELAKEFTVLEFDLPGRDILSRIASNIAESAGLEKDDRELSLAAEAARGLTAAEAEDVMALAVVEKGRLDPVEIAAEKARAIGRDGILEVINPDATEKQIGGLELLKNWLAKRRNAFGEEARRFGLPDPRGALILGVPGTGKSLTAKAAGSILERPILRLDAGRLFAGLVGESEGNLRRSLNTAEAIAPCILWIDEIEKGMSGTRGSSGTDGGTAARVFGSFVSWMQERTAPVFVIATANDVEQLPPELLRKGRFDELFFVDLPDEKEREEIWRIHLERRGRDHLKLDVKKFAQASDGFSGSEIEQALIDAMFDCFEAGKELDNRSVLRAVESTVPLGVTMSEQISRLRQWAKNRARPASEGKTGTRSKNTKRRIAA